MGFTFRRDWINRDYVPDWNAVSLGRIEDGAYLKRLLHLLRASLRVLAGRRMLAGASFFYARNLDLCLLALLGRWVSGSRAPLVYEVLDVRSAFLGSTLRARVLRWIERRALGASRLLVLSSPGFHREYFLAVQRYDGPWFLLENKLFPVPGLSARPPLQAAGGRPALRAPKPWTVGWFSVFQCRESLQILCEAAAALPDAVEIYLRGYPKFTDLETFKRLIAPYPNVIYDGPYKHPQDLDALYGRVDLIWCVDLVDKNANSHWLLPNRLYEGGYFNVPALAAAGSETARKVAEMGIGWSLPTPHADALVKLLQSLSPEEHLAKRRRLASLPREEFCSDADVARLAGLVLRQPEVGKPRLRERGAGR